MASRPPCAYLSGGMEHARNAGADWQKAKSAKDLDVGLTVVSSILTILGGTGFGLSFTF